MLECETDGAESLGHGELDRGGRLCFYGTSSQYFA